MKKVSIVIVALIIYAVGFSQSESREKTRNEVHNYLEKNVFPLIEKQQKNYLKKLSGSENEELVAIKENLIAGRNEFSRGNKNGKGRGNYNQHGNRPDCPNGNAYGEIIKRITDAHPKQNDAYKNFIDANKQKWISDIKELHSINGISGMNGKSGDMSKDMLFNKISNPEWLLLWDSSKSFNMPHRYNKSENRSNYKGRKMSGKMNNSQNRGGAMANISTDNFDVIAKERIIFDKQLSAEEIEIIETARQKRMVRKVMFKNWHESEDFVPGKRANDPNFDGLREDMRNSMMEVREIAIAHSDELLVHMETINNNFDRQSNKGVRGMKNQCENPCGHMGMKRGNKHGSITPVAFLLFDPEKEQESVLIEDVVKVNIYPNPIVQNAIIAINGAMGENVQITLLSKDGETIRDLYNSRNMEESLEVNFSVKDLSNDIYLVKVTSGLNEITRKIVVATK